MIVGYDPWLVGELGRQVRSGIGGLDAITSSDPAAAEAIGAARRLSTVLAGHHLAAVTAIASVDPLVRASSSNDVFDDWLAGQLDRRTPTRFDAFSDIDLATLFHVELTRVVEGGGDIESLSDWVREFERRSGLDDEFAARMIAEAATNPLIGIVVARGRFDGVVVLRVARALMDAPSNGAPIDARRDLALSAVLESIADRPPLALDLLIEPGMVDRLLSWNDDEGAAFGVGGSTIGALFDVALRLPFVQPARLDDARAVIATLAELAPLPRYDRGFAPFVAAGITSGLLGHLPSFIRSLGDESLSVSVFEADGVRGTALGTKGEIIELFGALVRDAESRTLLLATIPTLALADRDDLFDVEDVNAFAAMLSSAAEREVLDERAAAERRRADLNVLIEVATTLISTALSVAGAPVAAKVGLTIAEVGARWLVDRIDTDELGLDEVGEFASLLALYGTALASLEGRPADDPEVERAREQAACVEGLMDGHASLVELDNAIYRLGDITGTT